MLLLFTVGAAVPVFLLATLSVAAISGRFERQSAREMSQATDIAAQTIMARLSSYRTMLETSGVATLSFDAHAALPSLLPPGVVALEVKRPDRAEGPGGSFEGVGGLTVAEEERLSTGGTVLRVELAPPGEDTYLIMAVRVPGAMVPAPVAWGRIVGDSVWSPALTQISDASVSDVCVLDGEGRVLRCLAGAGSGLASAVAERQAPGASGTLEFQGEGGHQVAALRSVILQGSYSARPWTVALSRPAASAPMALGLFGYNLLIVTAIALSLILLLTHVMVRRTLEPLQELAAGTRRIADRDLTTRVDVRTNDEFSELAGSFNAMADDLGLQFRQLEAGRTIDQAVLTTSDQKHAVEALLQGIGEVVDCAERAAVLFDAGDDATGSQYFLAHDGEPLVVKKHDFADGPHTQWKSDGRPVLVQEADQMPDLFRTWLTREMDPPMLLLPLVVQGERLGLVVLTHAHGTFSEGDRARARGLVDRAAVGLNELRLRDELEQMSWEAMSALANAIDAKSRWTTGHSERVVALALELGRELDLDEEQMGTLHRGGLLHDIGKIGISSRVLDFPGRLNAEQRSEVCEHPVIGARILRPLRAFQPILPIVLHHHERWDGDGYPEGLRGLEIPRLARLLAVADVFDALTSDRPYRAGMEMGDVIEEIRSGDGSQFDPEMVQAFEVVIADGWMHPTASAGGGANA